MHVIKPERTHHAVIVVGTRPNLVKAAPLVRAAEAMPTLRVTLLHTRQHYDDALARALQKDLKLPAPWYVEATNYSLDRKSRLSELQDVITDALASLAPDVVIVLGDVDSTLAAARAAQQLKLPIAHVEAGLRSGDLNMPEEVNRIEVDQLSERLYVTEKDGVLNLEREGFAAGKIKLCGNVMIDQLQHIAQRVETPSPEEFALVTLHRASLTASRASLTLALASVARLAERMPVKWVLHPRVRHALAHHDLHEAARELTHVELLPPLLYSQFVALMVSAKLIMTDSGGLVVEAAVLGKPCLVYRTSLEAKSVLRRGTHLLPKSLNPDDVAQAVESLLMRSALPLDSPLADGKAAMRIMQDLTDWLATH